MRIVGNGFPHVCAFVLQRQGSRSEEVMKDCRKEGRRRRSDQYTVLLTRMPRVRAGVRK